MLTSVSEAEQGTELQVHVAQAKELSLHKPLQPRVLHQQGKVTWPHGLPSSLSPQPLTVTEPAPAAAPLLPAGLSHPASGAAEDRQGRVRRAPGKR